MTACAATHFLDASLDERWYRHFLENRDAPRAFPWQDARPLSAAERRLVCGRCLAQWAYDPINCPFCANGDRSRITSFAARDGCYRVSACNVCRRYLKAYDTRNALRPVMVGVDTIATLPLDAAAIQRGYVG